MKTGKYRFRIKSEKSLLKNRKWKEGVFLNNKTGIIFAGQGSQYEKMGAELLDREEYSILKEISDKETYEKVIKAEIDDLSKTSIAQPAIFLQSICLFNELKKRGFDFSNYTGLSLGEYTALCAAEKIDIREAIELVYKRGRIMEEGVREKGAMTAVLKSSPSEIQSIIDEVAKEDILSISNLNSPAQTVVGGGFKAIERFDAECEERKIRTVRLNVQGPFHTEFLKESAVRFREELERVDFADNDRNVYSNYRAVIHEKDNYVENLERQMYSTVQFEDCIRKMIDAGCTSFVEIGPGKVLSGFIRKIDKKIETFSISSLSDIEKYCSLMR